MLHRRSSTTAMLLATLVACGPPQPDPTPTPPPLEAPPVAAAPPEVELAGCQATRREPLTCWLRTPTTELHLWIAGSPVPFVDVDGASAKARTYPYYEEEESGWTVEVDVPRTARELVVRTEIGGPPWRVALEPTESTAILDAIEAELPPENAPNSAALERALAKIESKLAEMSPYERIAAGRARTLSLYKLGRVDDALASGFATFDDALHAGRASEAIAIAEILIYALGQTGDQAGVELLLDLEQVYLPVVADATQVIRWHYYSGMHAQATGDARYALEHLEAAERGARRLQLTSDELSASALRAPLLGWLGRHRDLELLIARILALTTLSPRSERCSSPNHLSNAGWAVLLARAHFGESEAANPEQLFERAIAFYSKEGGCEVGDNPIWRRDVQEVLINHALEAVMRSDWSTAAVREQAIAERELSPVQHGWLKYIRGELAMSRGDFAAAIDRTTGLERSHDPLLAWQGSVLRGRALEAIGRDEAALQAYRKAETLVDQFVRRVGVDQGREGLTAGMHSGAAHAIRLQLAHGDVETAIQTARRSRSRALRPVGRAAAISRMSPDVRSRFESELSAYNRLERDVQREYTELWRLPQDARADALRKLSASREEMRAKLNAAYDLIGSVPFEESGSSYPASGELWLLYHPLPEGWVGFAIMDRTIEFSRFGDIETHQRAQLADVLLKPFASAIDAAARVDILAMERLDDVSFHTLQWHDKPLIATLPVAYRLDVGGTIALREHREQHAALVVAGPAISSAGVGRLNDALQEGKEVAGILGRGGWRVVHLDDVSATHDRVVEALPTVDWLHFAGHGYSVAGWDSALPLAGEATIDVRQILALPRVPAAVVLSGCSTGVVDRGGAAGGQHLAGAFLLAGAEFVIATSADVGDAEAKQVARALYEVVVVDPRSSGPELLRKALVRSDEARSITDGSWEQYRAWVP